MPCCWLHYASRLNSGVRPNVILRDFQICLRNHDPDTYRQLRVCWDPVELALRRSIPAKCEFGGVRKLVLELGPEAEHRPDYRVLLNVGLFHYAQFNALDHLGKPEAARTLETLDLVDRCMSTLALRLQASADWALSTTAALRVKS